MSELTLDPPAESDPHHHRKPGSGALGRRLHVDVQAIFAEGTIAYAESVVSFGSCMQTAEKWSAAVTPCHDTTGCGGRQRSSPTGGAANGIPL